MSSNEVDVEVAGERQGDETNWLSENERHGDPVQGGFELGEGIAGPVGRRRKRSEVSIIELDSLLPLLSARSPTHPGASPSSAITLSRSCRAYLASYESEE